jgi:hypothetical protein
MIAEVPHARTLWRETRKVSQQAHLAEWHGSRLRRSQGDNAAYWMRNDPYMFRPCDGIVILGPSRYLLNKMLIKSLNDCTWVGDGCRYDVAEESAIDSAASPQNDDVIRAKVTQVKHNSGCVCIKERS